MLKRTIRYSFIAFICILPAGGAALYSYCFLVHGEDDQPRRDVIEFDIGDVSPGSTVDRTIPIPNKTDSILTITSIEKDCSCVVQKVDRMSIPPGGHADLYVRYQTPLQQGAIDHFLSVSFDEITRPAVVSISGTVASWVNVDPMGVSFSDVCAGERSAKEVVVRVTEAWPESERGIELQLEHGQLSREESRDDGKYQKYRLVFAPPPTAPCKTYQGDLVIRWAGRAERILKVPCKGTVVSQWCVAPTEAFFGIVPKGANRQIDLLVRKRGRSTDVNSRRLTVSHNLGSAFRVRSSTTSANELLVSVSMNTADATATGFLNGGIEIVGPAKHIVASIPVRALVKDRL